MSTYSEKLRDPRWQRRRLEIFDRDGFACRRCGATHLTLHVHHLIYHCGLEPWEYPGHLLITLCEPHHKEEEVERHGADARLIQLLRNCGAMNTDVDRISEILTDLIRCHGPSAALAVLQHAMEEIPA